MSIHSKILSHTGLVCRLLDIPWQQWLLTFSLYLVSYALDIYHVLTFYLLLASSTDVECAFSKGGLTVSKFRHSLSDESACAASVLGSWAELEGAIPKDLILQLFKDKDKRPKKKKKTDELEHVDVITVT